MGEVILDVSCFVPWRSDDLLPVRLLIATPRTSITGFSKHVGGARVDVERKNVPLRKWKSPRLPCARISWAAWRPLNTLGSRWASSEVQRAEFIKRKIYGCLKEVVVVVGGGSFLPHVQYRWVFFSPTPLRREMCFSVWVLHLGSVSLDWTGGEASFHRWWSGCVRWTFASLFPFFLNLTWLHCV